jgi:hypothetical protein
MLPTESKKLPTKSAHQRTPPDPLIAMNDLIA